MPTYEYRCTAGHDFDLVQKMSDEPRAICPECGSEAQRLLSAGAGLLFKGEGFYITDYRSDAYRKAQKAETKGGEGAKSEASGEGAKPEASKGRDAGSDGAKPSEPKAGSGALSKPGKPPASGSSP